jgi:hypothetical protein
MGDNRLCPFMVGFSGFKASGCTKTQSLISQVVGPVSTGLGGINPALHFLLILLISYLILLAERNPPKSHPNRKLQADALTRATTLHETYRETVLPPSPASGRGG